MKRLSLLLALLLCQPVSAALTRVQDKLITNPGASGLASENYAFDSSVTAGNTVVLELFVTYGGGSYFTFSCVDSNAVAGTEITQARALGGFSNIFKAHAFRWHAHAGGVTTFTCSLGGGDVFGSSMVRLVEISGSTPVVDSTAGTPNAAGQAQATPGTGTDAVTSGNATPSKANTLGLGMTRDADENGGTISVGTGWTLEDTASNVKTEYQAISGTSALAATFTHSVAAAHLTQFIIVSETAASMVVNPITGRGGTAAQPVSN